MVVVSLCKSDAEVLFEINRGKRKTDLDISVEKAKMVTKKSLSK